MSKTVLVTGGAGFIGTYLNRELLGRGKKVIVLDDLSTGQKSNLEEFSDNPDFSYHVDTCTNEKILAELMEQVDEVVHLAAAVGVMLIVEDPVRTIETNILGSELVLRCAREQKKELLMASTSEVYGKSTQFPFQEESDVVFGATNKSRWAYAASKMIDEFLSLAYHRQYDLPVRVVRFFNTVGRGQVGHYGMVIPRLVEQALKGEALTVFGDGKQQRCFGYVGDVVKGVADLLECEAAIGQVVNLGNNQEITILELAEKINNKTGNTGGITMVPYENAYAAGFEDMRRRVPDLTRAIKLVDFKITTQIDEILDGVILGVKEMQA
jgi:UDP-glucose 4-epimerase